MNWKWLRLDWYNSRKIPYMPKRKETSAKNDFKVEHYPISGLYFPKVNSYYLETPSSSGAIRLVNNMLFGMSFDNPEDAWKEIDKYIEQRLKPTATVIRR